MRPGPPALGRGTVGHFRSSPVSHDFTQPVMMIWIDPDRPGDLLDQEPVSSTRRAAPIRFRDSDYGDDSSRSLGDQVRSRLASALGDQPWGPIRMLTQPRVWGWLFNPITLYLAWNDPREPPVGAVVEVTNTPWKERHHYAVRLEPEAGVDRTGRLTAVFDKSLHVSPFLGLDYRYEMTLAESGARLELEIDVIDADDHRVLATRLDLARTSERPGLRTLLSDPATTHRVSAGIHRQAARLWSKGVPFVTHPSKQPGSSASTRERVR